MATPTRLDASSLYISTEFQFASGFHWALYITAPATTPTTENDIVGAPAPATLGARHEWAEDPSRALPEKYIRSVVKNPAAETYTPEGRLVFAYFKVAGYKHAAPSETPGHLLSRPFSPSLVLDVEWDPRLDSVFPSSHPSCFANRKAGMSCRSWVVKALGVLIERGWILREDAPRDIVMEAVRLSNEFEVNLGTLKNGAVYQARIMKI